MTVSFSKNDKISNDLRIIILIFLLIFASIYFTKYLIEDPRVAEHKDFLDNINSQGQLISVLQENSLELKHVFFAYQSKNDTKDYRTIYKSVKDQLVNINKIVLVLGNGGAYRHEIKMIDDNYNYYSKYIIYKRVESNNFKPLLTISPLLKSIEKNNNKIFSISKNENDLEKIDVLVREIEPLLLRLIALSNTASFAMHKEIDSRTEIETQRLNQFLFFKTIFLLSIILVSFFLAYRIYKKTKRVEKSLVESMLQNRVLSQAIEQSSFSFVLTDTSGSIEYVNKYFTDLTGYSKEEAIGNNPRILKSGKMSKLFYQQMWDKLLVGEKWKGEICNISKSGKEFWEMADIFPLKNEKGKTIKYVAVKKNITENRNLKNSLSESSQVLETLMNNVPLGIVLLSPQQQIVSINSEAARILQYKSLDDANSVLLHKKCSNYISHNQKQKHDSCDVENGHHELKDSVFQGKRSKVFVSKRVLPITIGGELMYLETFFDNSNKKKNIILTEQKLKIQKANNDLNIQNEEITKHLELIRSQKNQILEIHKQVSESIYYAERIQKAALPQLDNSQICIPDFFTLYKPKYVISGDFYWIKQNKEADMVSLAVADCTGHGVPGAFLSMLGIAFLNELVHYSNMEETGLLLDKLKQSVIDSLHQTGATGESQDGMDMALLTLNCKTNVIQFSGANNPLYIVREINGKNVKEAYKKIEGLTHNLYEIKPDKMPIGIYYKVQPHFTKYEIQLEKGDQLYMFSDGYVDQFGGPESKKMKSPTFKNLLLSNASKPMNEQSEILNSEFENWRGNENQTDDIIVVGLKV